MFIESQASVPSPRMSRAMTFDCGSPVRSVTASGKVASSNGWPRSSRTHGAAEVPTWSASRCSLTPSTRVAAALEASVRPSRSLSRIPSSSDETTARYRSSLSRWACSARLRAVMSRMVPSWPPTLRNTTPPCFVATAGAAMV